MEQAAPVSKPKTSGMAIWSLILSFIPIACLVGIILGIVSAVKIGKRKQELKGQGLAIGGIVIGALNALTSCFILPIFLVSGSMLAIAIPNFISYQYKAGNATVRTTARSVEIAVEMYKTEHNGERPMSVRDVEGFLPEETRKVKNPFYKGQVYSLSGGGLVDGEPIHPGQIGYIAPKSPYEPYEIVAKLKTEDFRLNEQISEPPPPEEPQGE